jgi:hypothetical protein
VPLFVVDEAIERIRDGTITGYTYDPKTALLRGMSVGAMGDEKTGQRAHGQIHHQEIGGIRNVLADGTVVEDGARAIIRVDDDWQAQRSPFDLALDRYSARFGKMPPLMIMPGGAEGARMCDIAVARGTEIEIDDIPGLRELLDRGAVI